METQPEVRHITIERYRQMKTAIIVLTILSSILTICVIQLIRSNQRMETQIEEIYSRHPDERWKEIMKHVMPLQPVS